MIVIQKFTLIECYDYLLELENCIDVIKMLDKKHYMYGIIVYITICKNEKQHQPWDYSWH